MVQLTLELCKSTYKQIVFNKYLYCFDLWLECWGCGGLIACIDLCRFIQQT